MLDCCRWVDARDALDDDDDDDGCDTLDDSRDVVGGIRDDDDDELADRPLSLFACCDLGGRS